METFLPHIVEVNTNNTQFGLQKWAELSKVNFVALWEKTENYQMMNGNLSFINTVYELNCSFSIMYFFTKRVQRKISFSIICYCFHLGGRGYKKF